MFGVFQQRYDQWTLSGILLIDFSESCEEMANTCTFSPADTLLVLLLLQKMPQRCRLV